MLKKIALLMLLILPMGVFAQNLKFGHINAMDLGDAVYNALSSTKSIGRVLATVNADQAIDDNGEPLAAVEL